MPDSPLPGPDDAMRPTPVEEQNNLLLRMLYDEQARLRAELETVRSQKEGGKDDSGDDKRDKGGEDKDGGDKEKKDGGQSRRLEIRQRRKCRHV